MSAGQASDYPMRWPRSFVLQITIELAASGRPPGCRESRNRRPGESGRKRQNGKPARLLIMLAASPTPRSLKLELGHLFSELASPAAGLVIERSSSKSPVRHAFEPAALDRTPIKSLIGVLRMRRAAVCSDDGRPGRWLCFCWRSFALVRPIEMSSWGPDVCASDWPTIWPLHRRA